MHRATTYDQFNTRRDLQRTTVSDEINSVERRELEKTCQLTKTVRVKTRPQSFKVNEIKFNLGHPGLLPIKLDPL